MRIETERLWIEEATAAEIPAIMEIEHDAYNSLWTFTGTAEEHLAEIEDPDTCLLAIKTKKDGKIIGYFIVGLDRESEWMELRRLALAVKDEGYGREVILALTRQAFEGLHLNKVWLEAYDDNDRAMHLYQALGFHIDGVLRQHHKTARGILNQVQFSMLKDEYRALYGN